MNSVTSPADVEIPYTVDALTAEWFTAALAQHFPGARVSAVNIMDVLAGACLKVRVRLTYAAGTRRAGFPEHAIVKGNFRRRGADLAFMFQDEMRAYRDVMPMLDLNTPACYFAGERNGETILILEDLTSDTCVFGAIEQALSFAQAQALLGQLAKLHAHFWNRPELAADGALTWISPSLDSAHLSFIRALLQPERWARYRGFPRGMVVPRHLVADPDRLDRALLLQQAFHRRGIQTICHGDAHTANTYRSEKGSGFFDWALRRGPWHYDVTYLLTIALDVADRRRWEAALLQYYLEQLASRGVTPPAFDQAWLCHRRELAFGCVLFVGNGDPGENWQETATCAAAFRFGMAAEDHGMFAAIGV